MNHASQLARRLGLALSPLGVAGVLGEHFALLDGRSASFACSMVEKPDVPEETSRDWQWSADLAHHVLITPKAVQVRSGRDPLVRSFTRTSVDAQLEKFLTFLNARRSALPDIVPFLVSEFQEIWALSDSPDGSQALTAFLLSLCEPVKQTWMSSTTLAGTVRNPQRWGSIPIEPSGAKSTNNRSGARDTRARAFRSTPDSFFGAPPRRRSVVPRGPCDPRGGSVRSLRERERLDYTQLLTIWGIFHPSSNRPDARGLGFKFLGGFSQLPGNRGFTCGSGVFLTEALQALDRVGFRGKVRLIGRDKSPQAIIMANVAVGTLRQDFPTIEVDCDISRADAFESEWPNADIVLMNPPFRSWEGMSSRERDWVHSVVGETGRGRPDLSVAFIERVMKILNPGGVVATLVPAGVLASESLYKWRASLAQRATPTLVAVLGEHGLFQHALVNVGVIALRALGNQDQSPDKTPLCVGWSSADVGSASKAMRAIRRSMSGISSSEPFRDKAGWSFTTIKFESWKLRPSWLPGAGALGPLLEAIQANVSTKVGDLFDVHQGIRTGANEVFLRSGQEVHNLPAKEQAYFKEAVDAASFVDGEIRTESYLFCHDRKWRNEEEVSRAVPTFFNDYLKPAESMLRERKSLLGDRWWELTRARGWMFDGRPRLLSKRFGLYPSFARDFRGSFAVVQANAWLPTGALTMGQDKDGISETLIAFWWLLNSRVAVALFREFCPNVAGGQLDLENKYVKNVPLPNLQQELRLNPSLQALSISLRSRNRDRLPILSDLDDFAAAAYDTPLSEWNLSGLELPR